MMRFIRSHNINKTSFLLVFLFSNRIGIKRSTIKLIKTTHTHTHLFQADIEKEVVKIEKKT